VVTDGWQDGHVPNKPTHHVTAEWTPGSNLSFSHKPVQIVHCNK
jgi:hypothetical protein